MKLRQDQAAGLETVKRMDAEFLGRLNAKGDTLREEINQAFARKGIEGQATGAGSLFKIKNVAGIDMIHVPYKGGPPALRDVAAGQVALCFAVRSQDIQQCFFALGVDPAGGMPDEFAAFFKSEIAK